MAIGEYCLTNYLIFFQEGDVVDGTREIFDDERISNLRNLLEASVITELNLVPEITKQLVAMLRKIISKLDWMVPQGLYLPAPPLYCPQPTRNDGVSTLLLSYIHTTSQGIFFKVSPGQTVPSITKTEHN